MPQPGSGGPYFSHAKWFFHFFGAALRQPPLARDAPPPPPTPGTQNMLWMWLHSECDSRRCFAGAKPSSLFFASFRSQQCGEGMGRAACKARHHWKPASAAKQPAVSHPATHPTPRKNAGGAGKMQMAMCRTSSSLCRLRATLPAWPAAAPSRGRKLGHRLRLSLKAVSVNLNIKVAVQKKKEGKKFVRKAKRRKEIDPLQRLPSQHPADDH